MLVCVGLSEGPGAPAGVWGPSRRDGAVVTSPFFFRARRAHTCFCEYVMRLVCRPGVSMKILNTVVVLV